MLHTFGYKDKKTYSNNQTLSKKDYCPKRFYIKNAYLSNPFDPKIFIADDEVHTGTGPHVHMRQNGKRVNCYPNRWEDLCRQVKLFPQAV
jgi:hypothetical protein